jgi:hypothetical protein
MSEIPNETNKYNTTISGYSGIRDFVNRIEEHFTDYDELCIAVYPNLTMLIMILKIMTTLG